MKTIPLPGDRVQDYAAFLAPICIGIAAGTADDPRIVAKLDPDLRIVAAEFREGGLRVGTPRVMRVVQALMGSGGRPDFSMVDGEPPIAVVTGPGGIVVAVEEDG